MANTILSEYFRSLGKKGGAARAKALSETARKKIAKQGQAALRKKLGA